jgi:predicted amino acid dehydrogenase
VERFAFIMHPLEAKRDIARKYPIARFFPESAIEWVIKHKDPFVVSHVIGVKSITGVEAEGWFIGCPLTPRQLCNLPIDFVYSKLIQAGKIAQDVGAGIIGLGAFTSIVGDGGITIAKNLDIAVTTGNSYTVATAIEGAFKAARMMDVDPGQATVAIVGATGSIGRTCAQILAREALKINLIGRQIDRLNTIADEIRESSKAAIKVFTEVEAGIKEADIIVTVTSAVDAVILPAYLKPGAVVCDVARPRDVSVRVAKERDDVLVIEGGVVAVPGDVDFGFGFGFPPKTAYACMSETMMLALDHRYESFTLGKDVSVKQVEEISGLATKHGFTLAGFRSFEKAVTEESIRRVRDKAHRKSTDT